MITQNSRFLVLSANGSEVIVRGAFVAQLDRSHYLVDTHADGLYSQRVVSPAEMKSMHIFPSDQTFNDFLLMRFPKQAKGGEDEFELSENEVFEDRSEHTEEKPLPESVVNEVGTETAFAEDSVVVVPARKADLDADGLPLGYQTGPRAVQI